MVRTRVSVPDSVVGTGPSSILTFDLFEFRRKRHLRPQLHLAGRHRRGVRLYRLAHRHERDRGPRRHALLRRVVRHSVSGRWRTKRPVSNASVLRACQTRDEGGFKAAIDQCADVLEKGFPARSDDNPNELSDAVVVLPRA